MSARDEQRLAERNVRSVARLRSKRAVARCFTGRRPLQQLLIGIVTMALLRAVAGGWAMADLGVVAIGMAVIGPVEWVVHRRLFHAPETSWRWRRLGTGKRHRRHHDDPTDLDWLLLDRRGVTLLMAGTALLAAVWAVPIAVLVGQSIPGLYLSAVIVAWLALANYEWTHLLTHAGYRLTSRRYRRLARRHLTHHHRDERQWLGVTSHLGDHLFGTASLR